MTSNSFDQLENWVQSVISRKPPDRQCRATEQARIERYWRAPECAPASQEVSVLLRHPTLADIFSSVPEMKIGKSSRGTHRGRQGRFPTSKSGDERRVMRAASRLELENMLDHEMDPRCSRFVEQPVLLRYLDEGKKRHHRPDALVLWQGRLEFQEVKYEKEATGLENLWKTISAAVNSLGFDYRVRTERDIRRQPRYDNVWRIYEDRFAPLPPKYALSSLEGHLRSHGAISLGNLTDKFAVARDQINALIRLGCLAVDLDATLTLESPVSIGHKSLCDLIDASEG